MKLEISNSRENWKIYKYVEITLHTLTNISKKLPEEN